MKRIAKIFLIIGIICILIAFSLWIYFNYEEVYSKKKSDETIKYLVKEISDSNVEETINIDEFEYIGYLIIPSLNLKLPITKNYTTTSLNISPSVYYGSIKSNNLVICGHSYKAHFGNLYKLNQGEEVVIVDVNNNTYTYQVELTEILDKTNIKEMIESDFDLTLYTCTKDGLKRVTVRLNRTN